MVIENGPKPKHFSYEARLFLTLLARITLYEQTCSSRRANLLTEITSHTFGILFNARSKIRQLYTGGYFDRNCSAGMKWAPDDRLRVVLLSLSPSSDTVNNKLPGKNGRVKFCGARRSHIFLAVFYRVTHDGRNKRGTTRSLSDEVLFAEYLVIATTLDVYSMILQLRLTISCSQHTRTRTECSSS